MKPDVIVKDSEISGRGVFANRGFKKGELVIKYNPIKISKEEFEKMNEKEKESVFPSKEGYMKHTSPAIFTNHSCDCNTLPSKIGDIAIRDIKKGEEITTDYSKDSKGINMKCNCGSKNCRGIIK